MFSARSFAYAGIVNAPASRVPAADRLTRFSDRAETYAQHRPSYPPTAFDALLADLPESANRAADIGAGTGISSRLLADRGWNVIAIEPNAAMRSASVPHERIIWRDATGESTRLADRSVDLILCAQAFHWLDPVAAIGEFRRILTAGGRIALLWNVHDEHWPASHEFKSVMVQHATEPPTSPWFRPAGEPLASAAGLRNARIIRVPNHQTLDREGLLGRAASASYAPKQGPAHAALTRALNDLFDRHQQHGAFTLRYLTEVHLAETAR